MTAGPAALSTADTWAMVLRWERFAARRVMQRGVLGASYADVLSEVRMALFRVFSGYDPARGHPSTFVYYALGIARRALIAERAGLSSGDVDMIRTARHIEADLAQRLGRWPSIREVAQAAGCNEARTLRAFARMEDSAALPYNRATTAGDEQTIEEAVGHDPTDATLDRVALRQAWAKYAHLLTPRESAALDAWCQGQPFTDIGALVGTTRERARQIVLGAVHKFWRARAADRTAA